MAVLTGQALLEILQSHSSADLAKPLYIAVGSDIQPYTITEIEAKTYYVGIVVTSGLGE